MNDTDYSNVASCLRDLAANSDHTTGKVLKAADKAAKEGKAFVKVECTREDYNYVLPKSRYDDHDPEYALTPMVEKLKSLGFTLFADREPSFWGGDNYYLIVRW
jgi:hypothetical protein